MQKRPWFFDSQMLVLQQWKPNLEKDNLSFRRGPMWIQVRGLPNHWSSNEVGWKLGKLLLFCLNVVLPEHGSKEGRMLRLLVELELEKPLLRGTKIKLNDKLIWVDFKYEHLPTFCFYCGIMEHPEKVCERKMNDSKGNCICKGQYGEWLRAPLVRGGRRGESADSRHTWETDLQKTRKLDMGLNERAKGIMLTDKSEMIQRESQITGLGGNEGDLKKSYGGMIVQKG